MTDPAASAMFCANCGQAREESSAFCTVCGHAFPSTADETTARWDEASAPANAVVNQVPGKRPSKQRVMAMGIGMAAVALGAVGAFAFVSQANDSQRVRTLPRVASATGAPHITSERSGAASAPPQTQPSAAAPGETPASAPTASVASTPPTDTLDAALVATVRPNSAAYSGPADAWYKLASRPAAGSEVTVVCGVTGALGSQLGSRGTWAYTSVGWMPQTKLSTLPANLATCDGSISNPRPTETAYSASSLTGRGPWPILSGGLPVPVRTEPSLDAPTTGKVLADGDFITVTACRRGDAVSSPAGGGNDQWDELSLGAGYVPDSVVNSANRSGAPVPGC